ncbi:hypothetical protein [Reichenbachiella sp. MALMAid0571]|uniref:hypothetical protein n=1 Tax=Reichenbachiella sp. MALMAid0571 TaxID=3143939 RepID=UPI0032E022EF
MRIPSIIKTPKYNRFKFEPRHYDPIKEEIEEKLKMARAQKEFDTTGYQSSISAAFSKRQKKNSQASTFQLILAIVLMGTFVGWLFYGNQFFYAYLLLSPIYFYWRLKNKWRKS